MLPSWVAKTVAVLVMGHRYHFFVAIANALEPLQLKRGGAFVMVYRADDDAALHSVTTTSFRTQAGRPSGAPPLPVHKRRRVVAIPP